MKNPNFLMETRPEFSIAEGLAVQKDQLLLWKSILKSSCFNTLMNHVTMLNATGKLKTGYDVWRGVDIDNWIQNKLNEKGR